jgi:parvulin-like peptidyl-prolyl isomerase
MTKARLTVVALVSLGVLFAAGCGGGGVLPPDAVATVSGEKVTRSALDELLNQAKASYKLQTPPQTFPQAGTSEYQALEKQAVAYLVRQTEFEQQAKTYGISISSADVDKGTADIVKKYFGGDQKKFEAALKKQGTTVAEYRKSERTQLLVNRLTAEITKNVTVTDADVKSYYDKNKSTYTTQESRTMRHILVKTLALANKLYAQLKAGADFAKLEKKYSLDTGTNQQGGTLTITKGQTVAEYEKVAFSLPTGTISKPVHSKQYGYFIIKPVSALTPAHTKTLAEVSKDIKTTLLSQRKNDALTAWSQNLAKIYAHKVKYATGFEPPAAATSTSAGTTTTG